MKRGQTEVSLGTILLVILGVVGLVVVGLFIYNAYSRVGEGVDALPGGITIAAAACNYVVSLDNQGSYCGDFKEIKVGGNNQWANCEHLRQTWGAEVDIEGKDWSCKENADGTAYDVVFCNSLKDSGEEDYEKTIVNGRTCEAVLGVTEQPLE